MALTQIKTPYEFLARWDNAGVFKGAHIAFIERIMDGDVELSSKVGDAQPVSIAGETGFPLADALAALNISAVSDGEAKAAQIVTLAADKTAADTAKTEAQAARDAALAQVQELQAKLTAYESPADINGVPEWVYASQAYKALIQSGSMAGVKAMLAADTSIAGQMALADFEKSARFYRTNPTLVGFITKGAFTDAQMDGLFKLAATFKV